MSISLYHGKKNNFKSLKKLISGESRDVNMHNNLILVYWAYSSNFSKLVSVCMLSTELCPLFVTLWKLACEPSLSMEFSRQEYCSGVLCPPQGDLYHHPQIFVFSWWLYFRWWLGSPPKVTEFHWVSPMYTSDMYVYALLRVFFLLVRPLFKEWRSSIKNTEEERENYLYSPIRRL